MATSSQQPETMDKSTSTGFWTPMKITVLVISLVVLAVIGYGVWMMLAPQSGPVSPLRLHW